MTATTTKINVFTYGPRPEVEEQEGGNLHGFTDEPSGDDYTSDRALALFEAIGASTSDDDIVLLSHPDGRWAITNLTESGYKFAVEAAFCTPHGGEWIEVLPAGLTVKDQDAIDTVFVEVNERAKTETWNSVAEKTGDYVKASNALFGWDSYIQIIERDEISEFLENHDCQLENRDLVKNEDGDCVIADDVLCIVACEGYGKVFKKGDTVQEVRAYFHGCYPFAN